MRALVMHGSRFSFEEIEKPTPAGGQLLVRPLFNGICGSDLHVHHQMAHQERELGGTMQLPKMVLGHEFSAEVVAIGAQTLTEIAPGDRVVALPFSPTAEPSEIVNIGLSPAHPGAMAGLMLIDAERAFRVPDGVPDDLAALTEPLSVGRHASRLANRQAGPNIIVGCGPIGLAVLLALKDDGRGPVLAVDLSAERRAIALELGAEAAFDPAYGSPYTQWDSLSFTPDPPTPLLARDFAGRVRGLNIFDCTGAPAVLQQITREAPRHSHVIYAGVCMHEVPQSPVLAMLRELTIEYSFAYSPSEFRESLDFIARRPELVSRLVTSRVPLEQTQKAFERLHDATAGEIKILVDMCA